MFPCAVLHEIVKVRIVVVGHVAQLSGLAPYCPSSSGADCSHSLDHGSCGRGVILRQIYKVYVHIVWRRREGKIALVLSAQGSGDAVTDRPGYGPEVK